MPGPRRKPTTVFVRVILTSSKMECGGKRRATPLWLGGRGGSQEPKRDRLCALPALPAHSGGSAPAADCQLFVSALMGLRNTRRELFSTARDKSDRLCCPNNP